MVSLPSGRRAVALQLKAGWLAGATLNRVLEGESSCLLALFVSVTAEIEGWPAFHRDSSSQWLALFSLCGIGSTLLLGDCEASSAPEVGRSETLQQRKKRFLADEKVGKEIWAKIPGRGRKGAESP